MKPHRFQVEMIFRVSNWKSENVKWISDIAVVIKKTVKWSWDSYNQFQIEAFQFQTVQINFIGF